MNLKQLKTFVRVAELGSLSKAADRLRIAQPALSRQMKLLQTEIAVPLFERHRRGMQLTPPRHELMERVSGLIRQLDVACEDVRASAGEARVRSRQGTSKARGPARSGLPAHVGHSGRVRAGIHGPAALGDFPGGRRRSPEIRTAGQAQGASAACCVHAGGADLAPDRTVIKLVRAEIASLVHAGAWEAKLQFTLP